MILQRVTKSILRRDWFTVLVEILIVVVGILLGLQVNNWNEHRKSLAWEQRFLDDLATEFHSNREQLRQVVKLQETRGAALRDSLTLLETEQDP
jgi:cytoskeletal protein RodZ